MKKLFSLLVTAALLQACSNNGGQTGVQQDGMRSADPNGGLGDTPRTNITSPTDTAIGEHRVDVQPRNGAGQTHSTRGVTDSTKPLPH